MGVFLRCIITRGRARVLVSKLFIPLPAFLVDMAEIGHNCAVSVFC